MTKKSHPADIADLEKIKTATHFNVHLRRSPTDKVNHEAKTLREAILIADEISAGNTKPAMIYAITPEGTSVFVLKAAIDAERAAMAQEETGDTPKQEAPTKKAPKVGARAAVIEDAKNGIIPAAPDFSAATHARFRKKLAEIVAMVEAGDIDGLKAFPINPVSSSPKAMAKYRDLAVMALEARAAKEVAA